MSARPWPQRDLGWQAAYLWRVSQPEVPSAAVSARLDELLDAVLEAGVPAEELFGAPESLAACDVAELGTADESVRASFGSGAKQSVLLMGITLLVPVVPLMIVLLVSTGWAIDVTARALVFSGCLALILVSCALIRSMHDASRPRGVIAMITVAAALLVAAVAFAMSSVPFPVVARGVPTLLVVLVAAVPGTVLLMVYFLLPDKPLRDEWSEEQWRRRFRAALITRGLPRRRALDHVRELQSSRTEDDGSSFEEYGHPVAFARTMTEHAPEARKRRWAISAASELVVPVLALVYAATFTDMWWWARVLIAIAGAVWLVLSARSAWGARPWKAIQ